MEACSDTSQYLNMYYNIYKLDLIIIIVGKAPILFYFIFMYKAETNNRLYNLLPDIFLRYNEICQGINRSITHKEGKCMKSIYH